jgi:hypothetical protein
VKKSEQTRVLTTNKRGNPSPDGSPVPVQRQRSASSVGRPRLKLAGPSVPWPTRRSRRFRRGTARIGEKETKSEGRLGQRKSKKELEVSQYSDQSMTTRAHVGKKISPAEAHSHLVASLGVGGSTSQRIIELFTAEQKN